MSPSSETCTACGGRGWHTAGGNDPSPCGRCLAGVAFASGDPLTGQVAEATQGPGVYEWGVLTFERPRGENVDVDIDADGTVSIEWTETSDDCYGTATRSVRFSAAEFDQLVTARGLVERAS